MKAPMPKPPCTSFLATVHATAATKHNTNPIKAQAKTAFPSTPSMKLMPQPAEKPFTGHGCSLLLRLIGILLTRIGSTGA